LKDNAVDADVSSASRAPKEPNDLARSSSLRSRSRRPKLRWRVERAPDPRNLGLYRIGAVFIGLVLALLLEPLFTSASAASLYRSIWTGTFGSATGAGNLLTIAVPLLLASLAASIPYRLGLWNVGIEGQMLFAAWAASGISYLLPHAPALVIIPTMIVTGMVAGALWILVPTFARIQFGVSEVITTFLLNFVAVGWITYWATGPWYAPSAAGGIFAVPIPTQADLGNLRINGAVVNWGILLAVILPFVFWGANRYTKWGYEVTMTGSSERVGRYAGIKVRRLLYGSMLMGGMLAGLAGTINMMGTTYQLTPGLSNNTGFDALVIAVLAGASEIGVLVLGLVYAFLLAAGDAVSVVGVPSHAVYAVIGITLVFGTFGEAYARLRLVRTRPRKTARNAGGVLESGDAPAAGIGEVRS